MNELDVPAVDDLIRTALAEDLGSGDVTTRATMASDRHARAHIRAKQAAVIAGMPLIAKVCQAAGGGVAIDAKITDGATVAKGEVLAELEGSASTLLSVERVILNLLQQLSGVATLTAKFVAAAKGNKARIVDTRKTVPGLRILQKYAVRVGGGANHRFGLSDGILIKNNHITAAGGIGPALAAARARAPHGLRCEIECRTMDEVWLAVAGHADAILLDNMSPAHLREAVTLIAGRAITEASGGVSLDTIAAIAASGVDLISVGALTHSAPAVDLHMLLSLT